jgi:hypothetical protein
MMRKLVMAVFAASLGVAYAEELAWPADFDSKLAAHIEAITPEPAATSGIVGIFARQETFGCGYLDGLFRNCAKPGFLLFLH